MSPMWQTRQGKASYREYIKALEADIQHANSLAASVPGDYDGHYVQMRLNYSPFAPFLLYLVEWMGFTCTDTLLSYLGILHILVYKVYIDGMPSIFLKERRATLKEFHGVLYPLLRQLEGELAASQDNDRNAEVLSQKIIENRDHEKDHECDICMENNNKMVMPNCGHSMCISCFHEWNGRSESCPFCRGSLRKITSGDLWVVVGRRDTVDIVALAKKNLRRFYLYIESLPLIMPDSHMVVIDYML